MDYQLFWIELLGLQQIEKGRDRHGIDETRGDADVAVPQAFEMQVDLFAMHADVRDGAARCNDLLAKLEGRRNPDRFDCGIHTTLASQRHHGC